MMVAASPPTIAGHPTIHDRCRDRRDDDDNYDDDDDEEEGEVVEEGGRQQQRRQKHQQQNQNQRQQQQQLQHPPPPTQQHHRRRRGGAGSRSRRSNNNNNNNRHPHAMMSKTMTNSTGYSFIPPSGRGADAIVDSTAPSPDAVVVCGGGGGGGGGGPPPPSSFPPPPVRGERPMPAWMTSTTGSTVPERMVGVEWGGVRGNTKISPPLNPLAPTAAVVIGPPRKRMTIDNGGEAMRFIATLGRDVVDEDDGAIVATGGDEFGGAPRCAGEKRSRTTMGTSVHPPPHSSAAILPRPPPSPAEVVVLDDSTLTTSGDSRKDDELFSIRHAGTVGNIAMGGRSGEARTTNAHEVVRDTSVRRVSNLPAWMMTKRGGVGGGASSYADNGPGGGVVSDEYRPVAGGWDSRGTAIRGGEYQGTTAARPPPPPPIERFPGCHPSTNHAERAERRGPGTGGLSDRSVDHAPPMMIRSFPSQIPHQQNQGGGGRYFAPFQSGGHQQQQPHGRNISAFYHSDAHHHHNLARWNVEYHRRTNTPGQFTDVAISSPGHPRHPPPHPLGVPPASMPPASGISHHNERSVSNEVHGGLRPLSAHDQPMTIGTDGPDHKCALNGPEKNHPGGRDWRAKDNAIDAKSDSLLSRGDGFTSAPRTNRTVAKSEDSTSIEQFATFLPPTNKKESVDGVGVKLGSLPVRKRYATFLPPTLSIANGVSKVESQRPPMASSLDTHDQKRAGCDVKNFPLNRSMPSCGIPVVHDSNSSVSAELSTTPERLNAMIHDSTTQGEVRATVQEINTQSPVRKNFIRIKLPKVAIKDELDAAAAAPVSDTSLRKLKLRISHSTHSVEKDTSEGQVGIARARLADALPLAAHSGCSLETKAQQILALARLRLKASMAGKDTVTSLTSHKPGEKNLAADAVTVESRKSALPRETPVSLLSEENIKHDTMLMSASMTSIQRPSNETITAAPKVSEDNYVRKSLQTHVGGGDLNFGEPTLPPSIIANDGTIEKEAKNLPPKKMARNPDKRTTPGAIMKSHKSSSKEFPSRARDKLQSKQLLDIRELDSDIRSDSETSTSGSSGSDSSISSSTSSSSSNSSSLSSSSSSSSSAALSASSSSSSSNGSISSASSSDSDLSSDDESRAPVQPPPILKQRSRKKKGAKETRRYSRKSSDNSFVAVPLPPKVNPPTEAEIRKILLEDSATFGESNCNWVRRSSRQPSKSVLNSAGVRDLVDKLKCNDSDMVVLKLKKYLNDPDIPPVIMNAALDALEENSNCQALYIQNFNNAMLDDQMLHLLRILQSPKCRIWCINVGETYNVSNKTWKKFAKGLRHTKVTHMYASEHTITPELKERFRDVIRDNRVKHTMHNDPNNLHVIVRCTHCWWNPINSHNLQPFIKNSGYEHVLFDKITLGVKGTTDGRINIDAI